MLVDLLIAICCGAVGLSCGWIAYPSLTRLRNEHGKHGRQVQPLQPSGVLEHEVDVSEVQTRLTEITNRLSLLTASVTASVNQHASELQSATELVREVESTRDPATLLTAMNRLLDASELMRDQLATAENKLVEQNQLLQNAQAVSCTDPLTQIANRRALDIHLEACVADSQRQTATLMILDIDHFKNFNDSYGHIVGDQILKKVAGLLQKQLGHVGIVARYGGEEFIAVFNGKAVSDCIDLAEDTRCQIHYQPVRFQDRTLRVTASMGLAQLLTGNDVRDSAEQWLQRADRALYKSKQLRDCGHAVVNDSLVPIPRSAKFSQTDPTNLSPQLQPPADSQPGDQQLIADVGLPKGLAGLIRGDMMHAEFHALSQGVKGVGLAFVTAVVRLDSDTHSSDDLQALAKTCRSVVRSADRIGLLDNRTLIIVMPNIDRQSALQKADRIRGNLILAHHGKSSGDENKLTASIALCSSAERPLFADMLKFALRMLETQFPYHRDQTLCSW